MDLNRRQRGDNAHMQCAKNGFLGEEDNCDSCLHEYGKSEESTYWEVHSFGPWIVDPQPTIIIPHMPFHNVSLEI